MKRNDRIFNSLVETAGIVFFVFALNVLLDVTSPHTLEASPPPVVGPGTNDWSTEETKMPSSTTYAQDAQSGSAGDTGKASTTEPTVGLNKLEELNQLSEVLVDKAGKGNTPATEFRIEARIYRELLRQLMLANREAPAPTQLPQDLLLDMVRMSALLHAAADCKTGFVITCPTDLLMQLKLQQARVVQGLNMTKSLHN